ncbi:UNVERIFIED_CONTAM: hypothetical protein K2H54_051087 [Gekko kuhli]
MVLKYQKKEQDAGCSLLRRLVTLISQHATTLASNEAFKKQAEGASDAAKKYMEENDKLKKAAVATEEEVGDRDFLPRKSSEKCVGELKLAGIDAEDLNAKGSGVLEENKALEVEVKTLKDQLASTKRALEKAESEALAMRKQAEGLTKEYDRLLDEHSKLQVHGWGGVF